MQGSVETEIKIRIGDVAPVAAKIRAAGFQEHVPRMFEANTLYDKHGELRAARFVLRLRQIGDNVKVTFKGPGAAGRHKNREEIETEVGSFAEMQRIFERLGYVPSFRYEKYRTEFKAPAGAGVITVDETPIGNFLEIEGAADWIDSTASRLGFSEKDYLLDSYPALYLADCERRGVTPGNMVFVQEA